MREGSRHQFDLTEDGGLIVARSLAEGGFEVIGADTRRLRAGIRSRCVSAYHSRSIRASPATCASPGSAGWICRCWPRVLALGNEHATADALPRYRVGATYVAPPAAGWRRCAACIAEEVDGEAV